jgi:hypothetical protein
MSLLWEHTAAALRAGDFLWRDRLDVSQLEKEVGQPARPRQTRLLPPHINRMPRVERPPIKPNVGAKPARLDEPLCTVVAALAQAHKRAKPEFVDVAVMWLDVIADRRRLDDADLRAIRTERVLEQLVPPDPRPAIRGVPLIPLRRLARMLMAQPIIRRLKHKHRSRAVREGTTVGQMDGLNRPRRDLVFVVY